MGQQSRPTPRTTKKRATSGKKEPRKKKVKTEEPWGDEGETIDDNKNAEKDKDGRVIQEDYETVDTELTAPPSKLPKPDNPFGTGRDSSSLQDKLSSPYPTSPYDLPAPSTPQFTPVNPPHPLQQSFKPLSEQLSGYTDEVTGQRYRTSRVLPTTEDVASGDKTSIQPQASSVQPKASSTPFAPVEDFLSLEEIIRKAAMNRKVAGQVKSITTDAKAAVAAASTFYRLSARWLGELGTPLLVWMHENKDGLDAEGRALMVQIGKFNEAIRQEHIEAARILAERNPEVSDLVRTGGSTEELETSYDKLVRQRKTA